MPTTIIAPTVEADFIFAEAEPFQLINGETIGPVRLHYAIYGALNENRDNAILVCHALSGSARAGDWWPQLFGNQGVFDLTRDCVICVNAIGSCYGSTGPNDINPATGRRYGGKFPLVTIRDWVSAQSRLIDHLGISRLRAVIGGSIGGMQAIQWAIDFPERVGSCVAIGSAPLSAMGLAFNHLQRQAIMNDEKWRGGDYEADDPPTRGLALARGMAMTTYKSADLFTERYGRNLNRNGEDPLRSLTDRYDISGYLDYQGDIFNQRFDANSYLIITRAMDNFHPGLGYNSEIEALHRIQANVLLVGISSDWLFPADDVRTLATKMSEAGVNVDYYELQSKHGHDSFLAEPEMLVPLLQEAVHNDAPSFRQTFCQSFGWLGSSPLHSLKEIH
ncbi:MAG: homoserine O-acetyltransferase [Acidobacteriota bacterium]|jgi:homoserine O-acetyltransferase